MFVESQFGNSDRVGSDKLSGINSFTSNICVDLQTAHH